MRKIYFKYKIHPGDLLRNTDSVELPNPDENLEDFLVWFLDKYQSDNRIAYLNDLYLLLDNEFSNDPEKLNAGDHLKDKTEKEIQEEITKIENNCKDEAYRNFYHLLLTDNIEIVKRP
jgi:replication fork clamp-binding protein CrfC